MSLQANFPIIVNMILYLSAFMIILRKRKKIEIAGFLLLVYLLSAAAGILLYYDVFNVGIKYTLTLFPFLFLFLTLIVAFRPIVRFESRQIRKIVEPSPKTFTLISAAMILFILANMMRFAPQIIGNLRAAITDASFLKQVYQEKMIIEASNMGTGGYNYLAILSNISAEITLLFFFYNLIRSHRKKLLSWGLGLATFLPIFMSLFTGNRGKIVTSAFSLIFLYLLFKPILEPSLKRKINIAMAIFGFCGFFIFTMITISRFGGGEKKINADTAYSLIYYQGQSMVNFNRFALSEDVRQAGDNSFPMVRNLLGLEYSRNILDRQSKWGERMSNIQGLFYTFVGDFIFDFGPYVTLILLVCVSLLVRRGTKMGKQYYFHQIVLLYIWYNICIQGVYYFMYKTIGGNLILIYSLMIYALFRMDQGIRNGRAGRIPTTP